MTLTKEEKALAWRCLQDAKAGASNPNNQQFTMAMCLRICETLMKAVLPEDVAPAVANGDAAKTAAP